MHAFAPLWKNPHTFQRVLGNGNSATQLRIKFECVESVRGLSVAGTFHYHRLFMVMKVDSMNLFVVVRRGGTLGTGSSGKHARA